MSGTISLPRYQALWRAQDGKCALSGVLMRWTLHPEESRDMALDYVDPVRGLDRGNVRLVCLAIARLHQAVGTDEAVVDLVRALVAHQDGLVALRIQLEARAS